MKFVVKQGKDEQHYVTIVADNGETMFTSEGYTTHEHALRAITDFGTAMSKHFHVAGDGTKIIDLPVEGD